MKILVKWRLLACAALMLGSACEDAAGPVPLKDVYVLSSIAGQPLPQVTINEAIVVTVLSDSLVFISDTFLDHRRRIHTSFASGESGAQHSAGMRGTYKRRGDVIFVSWHLGDSPWAYPDTLWLRSDEIVGSESVGARCLGCQPTRIAEFVYR